MQPYKLKGKIIFVTLLVFTFFYAAAVLFPEIPFSMNLRRKAGLIGKYPIGPIIIFNGLRKLWMI